MRLARTAKTSAAFKVQSTAVSWSGATTGLIDKLVSKNIAIEARSECFRTCSLNPRMDWLTYLRILRELILRGHGANTLSCSANFASPARSWYLKHKVLITSNFRLLLHCPLPMHSQKTKKTSCLGGASYLPSLVLLSIRECCWSNPIMLGDNMKPSRTFAANDLVRFPQPACRVTPSRILKVHQPDKPNPLLNVLGDVAFPLLLIAGLLFLRSRAPGGGGMPGARLAGPWFLS